jgi:hypothetical protein
VVTLQILIREIPGSNPVGTEPTLINDFIVFLIPSRQFWETFLFSIASRPALEPIQLSVQWVPGILSPVAKRQGSEADHSPPTNAEVKKGGIISPLPPYVFMAWCLDN